MARLLVKIREENENVSLGILFLTIFLDIFFHHYQKSLLFYRKIFYQLFFIRLLTLHSVVLLLTVVYHYVNTSMFNEQVNKCDAHQYVLHYST